MKDGIDLSTVHIINSHDVKGWPVTATITKMEFRPTGVHVEHTKRDGSAAWPNFRPAGWDGDLQYTLWIFLQIAGAWHGSGCIQFWQSCDQNGGPPENFAASWYYAADRWAPMTGHQPAPGELVGFMVSAGDARNSGAQSVQERSNIVAMPFPVSGAVYTAKPEDPPAPPTPEPPPQPDGLEARVQALEEKIKQLGDRPVSMPAAWRGQAQGTIAGFPIKGTVVVDTPMTAAELAEYRNPKKAGA